MFHLSIGFNWSCIFRSPGEELNRQRRVFSHCIGPASHKNYIPGITRTVHEMCLQILDTPQTFRVWTKLMVVKNLARIVYGFKIKDFDDEYVVLSEGLEKALKDLGAMGTHPIDVLPILRLLPTWIWGRKFRQDSSILRHFAAEVFRAPYNLSRGNTAKGTSHPDSMVEIMVAQNLQPDERTVKDEYSIKGAAATAYSAGAQTTTQTINSFILMMVCNPSVQAKAHDVVDRVFGGERLPELTDREREDLIYIEALLMEVYRWSSVVPLGVPHSLLNDDVYDGMLLHAGSTVISNVWGFLHDPEDYPEPMAFQPERFLEVGEGGIHSGYALRKDVPDPRSMAFGFGRRACPGRHLADSTVWLAIITLLCTFEFSKVPHPTEPGKFIEPDLEYNSAMSVSSPKPFKCVVKPRSKGTLELLRSALEGETD